jgi:hypothetical protein
MYYPDLSPYCYLAPESDTLNVGWLNAEHPFPTGTVATRVLDQLWAYCRDPVYLTFGHHACDWCGDDIGILVQREQETLVLGSAEIRVIGQDQIAYAAPDLIYHYITDHGYLPPDVFVQALIHNCFPPTSPEYQARFGMY